MPDKSKTASDVEPNSNSNPPTSHNTTAAACSSNVLTVKTKFFWTILLLATLLLLLDTYDRRFGTTTYVVVAEQMLIDGRNAKFQILVRVPHPIRNDEDMAAVRNTCVQRSRQLGIQVASLPTITGLHRLD